AAEKSSILPGIHVGISGEFYFGTSGENSRGIDSVCAAGCSHCRRRPVDFAFRRHMLHACGQPLGQQRRYQYRTGNPLSQEHAKSGSSSANGLKVLRAGRTTKYLMFGQTSQLSALFKL
uniref:hypothetical protein n=1 Tax=Rhizobium rhizogenes TaxID=359 RepID=UPI001F21A3F0